MKEMDADRSLLLIQGGRVDQFWLDSRRPCPWTMKSEKDDTIQSTYKESKTKPSGKKKIKTEMQKRKVLYHDATA